MPAQMAQLNLTGKISGSEGLDGRDRMRPFLATAEDALIPPDQVPLLRCIPL
jgi:hypothetical protein